MLSLPMSDYLGSVSVSIVSHSHGAMVSDLVNQLLSCREVGKIIVTRNISESLSIANPLVEFIDNPKPKGFGANHNAAFKQSRSPFFCVLNPDIEFIENPFPALLQQIQTAKLGVIGPKVNDPDGKLEDSARPFPAFSDLVRKLLGNRSASLYPDNIPAYPDWVAGMFMLFDSQAFREVGGFDECYFLYYEDVDICARLHKAGWSVGYCSITEVIHDARRDSHRKFRYLKWHLASMFRFLMSSVLHKVKKPR